MIGPEVELGEDCHLVSHVAIEGPTKNRRGKPILPFHFDWPGAAGHYLCGRTDAAGDWRPERDSRVCHHQPRDGEGRRMHARRRPQPDHGVYAHCARLPDWEPHHHGERGYAGRACDCGRLGDGRGAVSGASLCADWDACFYWRGHDDYAGCAAVFEDVRRARNARLWIECGGVGAAGIHQRTDSRKFIMRIVCCWRRS